MSASLFGQTTLISYNSSWKYLDNGTNQGIAWSGVSFNDASWASGNAQLGYGDGDEATVVSYGGNANKKYITTYFRKIITVTNAASYTGFTLSIKRDDGAVVYINGTERYRPICQPVQFLTLQKQQLMLLMMETLRKQHRWLQVF